MADERYYCIICKIPTEYIPELDQYSCGVCEQMFTREEVTPGNLIRPPLETILRNMLPENGR